MNHPDIFVEKFGELITTSSRAYEHARSLEGSKYKSLATSTLPSGAKEKVYELVEHNWKGTYELTLQYKEELLLPIRKVLFEQCCKCSMSESLKIFNEIFTNHYVSLQFVLQDFNERTDLSVEKKKSIARTIIESQKDLLKLSQNEPKKTSVGFRLKEFPNLGRDEHEWHQFSTQLKNVDNSLYLAAINIEIAKAFQWRNTELQPAINWIESIIEELSVFEETGLLLREAKEKFSLLKKNYNELQNNKILQDLREQIKICQSKEIPNNKSLEANLKSAKAAKKWDLQSGEFIECNCGSKVLIGQGDDFADFSHGFEILDEIDSLLHAYIEYAWLIDLKDPIIEDLETIFTEADNLNELAKHIDEYEFYGITLTNLFQDYICELEYDHWEGSMISGHIVHAYIEESDFKNYLKDLHEVHREVLEWVIERVPN